MNLSIGLVGPPNAGPEQLLLQFVVYIHAIEERLYGARFYYTDKRKA